MIWFLRSCLRSFFLNPLSLLQNPGLSYYKKRILRKILENSFKKNFENLNFKIAYKHKIFLAIAYSRGYFSDFTTEARNYLSVVSHEDFLQFIDLDDSLIQEIKEVKEMEHGNILIESNQQKNFRHIVFLGPSASEEDFLDLDDVDLIVFNKPPKKTLGAYSSKTLIILNNIFSKQKSSEVIAWKKKYPQANIISQQDISNSIRADIVFDLIPSSIPLGSPMGLQRTLFILHYYYTFEKIELRGFNFSLTKNPYRDWYPSIMKEENNEEFKKAIILTNLGHDLVFNILLTRLLGRLIGNISGEAIDISNTNIEENLDRFTQLYAK